jgi:AAA-like domain
LIKNSNFAKNIVKKMRYFNTSGPNITAEHYTLMRSKLIEAGLIAVNHSRYFTIWAPRQTGKSTYFRLLADQLELQGYQVAHVNFENYKEATMKAFLNEFHMNLQEGWKIDFTGKDLQETFSEISKTKDKKWVLIIDEVEGINPNFFGQFLHSIRNVYHSRANHALKSVILVGISNIVGVVQDNASPFNITDNLNVPYFTNEETSELLGQHEAESGQLFDPSVTAKISEITANQPGLVNGFASLLVKNNPTKAVIDYDDYLKVEDYYLTEAIDKNIANIINKASQYRSFVEMLLFTEPRVPFQINRENIKVLHTNGIIKKDPEGFVQFWVPLYQKCLHAAFYPYMNGEEGRIQENIDISDYFTSEGALQMPKVIEKYKEYALKRGFRYFLEFDENGNAISIKEAALMYSFETYINAFLGVVGGTSYIEAHTNLGRTDMIINIKGEETLVESKVYQNITQFNRGKEQVAYYANRMGLTSATYLVFTNTTVTHKNVLEQSDFFEDKNVLVTTYLVRYDLEKDF